MTESAKFNPCNDRTTASTSGVSRYSCTTGKSTVSGESWKRNEGSTASYTFSVSKSFPEFVCARTVQQTENASGTYNCSWEVVKVPQDFAVAVGFYSFLRMRT